MKKKILGLLLVVGIVAGVFAGCGIAILQKTMVILLINSKGKNN